MKSKITQVKSMMLAILFSFALISLSFGQVGIVKTDAPLVIDGLASEDAWSNATEIAIDSVSFDAPTITSASWKALWDDDYIYIYTSVEEDVHHSDEATSDWNNDCVEIFFDIGNTDGDAYDDGDYQIRYNIYNATLDFDGDAEATHLLSGSNYTIEIKIAWSDLIGELDWSAVQNAELGFEVQVNDNDGDGRIGGITWSKTENNAWNTPSVFGTIQLGSTFTPPVGDTPEIVKTDAPLVIDGLASEDAWSNATEIAIDSISFDAPTITSASWKALWDDDYIYIYTSVEEDVHHSDEATSDWNNDCVEIFFDIGNTDGDAYDDGDYQIRYNIYNATLDFDGDAEATHLLSGSNYTIEIKIAWNDLIGELDWSAVQNAELGFEVQVNDNDGDGRIGGITWSKTENNAWNTPSVFGTIQLGAAVSTSIDNIASSNSVEVFPNPVHGKLNIKNALSRQYVSIHNITGQTIKNVYVENNQIDVSDLKEGFYFIQVRDNYDQINVIKFLKR